MIKNLSLTLLVLTLSACGGAAESETGGETESETGGETKSEAGDGTESETDDETESETDDETESETDDETESETDDETESETDDETESETDGETESETDDETESETDDETNNNPIITFDASPLAYFAIKHGNNEWQKRDNKIQDIEVTDLQGDISIFTGCDVRGDRNFTVSHLRITENLTTQADWCDSAGVKEIYLASEQSSISVNGLSIENMILVASGDNGTLNAMFSDLSGPKTIVSSGYNFYNDEIYLYRKLYSQLDSDSTYTLDYFGEDAVKLETVTTAAEDGFTYAYDYRPIGEDSWGVELYSEVHDFQGADVIQGIVPASFIQEGDLFIHSYNFGSSSSINMLSESQIKISNLLTTPLAEYKSSDFTISEDKKSVSFTPKPSPIESLNSVNHLIFVVGTDYVIDASRFSESENILTLVDFNDLPDYSGSTPAEAITEPYVISFFNNGNLMESGSQGLRISTNYDN
jgi:hypothetical protein